MSTTTGEPIILIVSVRLEMILSVIFYKKKFEALEK